MIQRCYTCNCFIAQYATTFAEQKRNGVHARVIMDRLNIRRFCCRAHIISHVDLFEDFSRFSGDNVVLDNNGSTFHRKVADSRRVSCDTGEIRPAS